MKTAIYVRQSLDKKDSISIETQIDFCKREVSADAEIEIFKDKGFSGKNTDRPAFQSLLKQILGGKIEKLVVYKLDRISRSITDFSNIFNVLEENKVAFVSTSEKFDTSTPTGRAMLYIIMIFAQLERETISERIRDNYYARGKAGSWVGGPAPFGYDNVFVLENGKKIATLKANDDIEKVKFIFEEYANSNKSLGQIAKDMREKDNSMWNNIKLSRILHNPSYVLADVDIYVYYKEKGIVIVDNLEDFTGEFGCMLYGKRDRGTNKYRLTADHVLSISKHKGIINSTKFLDVQAKLVNNKQLKNTGKGKHTWLSGLLKCASCGYALNVKTYNSKAKKGAVKYLSCTGRTHAHVCTAQVNNVNLYEIEEVVGQLLEKQIKKLDLKNKKAKVAQVDNSDKLELLQLENSIDNLLNSLATSPETVASYINEKILELDNKKKTVCERISNKNNNNNSKKNNLVFDLPKIINFDILNMEEKRILAQTFIMKIEIGEGKIKMFWKH